MIGLGMTGVGAILVGVMRIGIELPIGTVGLGILHPPTPGIGRRLPMIRRSLPVKSGMTSCKLRM